MKNFFALCALLLFWIIASPNKVMAFGVSPVLIDTEVAAGEVIHGSIHLVNDEEEAQTYFLSVQKFLPKGMNGQQEFLPSTENSGLPQWLSFDRTYARLNPGQIADIAYAIRPPKKTTPGGYYVAVFFSNRAPVPTPDGRLLATSRTGVLFLVRVKGKAREDVKLSQFSLSKTSIFYDRLPIEFLIQLVNEGNVHILPQGTVTIRNFFGQMSAELPLNASQSRILPSSRRDFVAVWQKTPVLSGQGFLAELGEEWRNIAIGRYMAEAVLRGNGSIQPQIKIVYFWVFPWRTVASIGVGLVILNCLLMLYRLWFVRSAIRKTL